MRVFKAFKVVNMQGDNFFDFVIIHFENILV